MAEKKPKTWAFRPLYYTQTPNEYYDEMMRVLSPAGFKIVGCLIRQTFGWHRADAECSLTFFMVATGMTRPTVISGIKDGMGKGIIKRLKKQVDGTLVLYGGEPELEELEDVTGPNGGFIYRLVVVDETTGKNILPGAGGKNSLPDEGSGQNSLPPEGGQNSLPENGAGESNSFTSDGKNSLPKKDTLKKSSLKISIVEPHGSTAPGFLGSPDAEDSPFGGNSQNGNGAAKPKPTEPKPPSEVDRVIGEMVAVWGTLFPKKAQPKPTTESYRSKLKTRLKNPEWKACWQGALERAAASPHLQREGWFTFEWVLRNDQNIGKIASGVFDSFDKQIRAEEQKVGEAKQVQVRKEINEPTIDLSARRALERLNSQRPQPGAQR